MLALLVLGVVSISLAQPAAINRAKDFKLAQTFEGSSDFCDCSEKIDSVRVQVPAPLASTVEASYYHDGCSSFIYVMLSVDTNNGTYFNQWIIYSGNSTEPMCVYPSSDLAVCLNAYDVNITPSNISGTIFLVALENGQPVFQQRIFTISEEIVCGLAPCDCQPLQNEGSAPIPGVPGVSVRAGYYFDVCTEDLYVYAYDSSGNYFSYYVEEGNPPPQCQPVPQGVTVCVTFTNVSISSSGVTGLVSLSIQRGTIVLIGPIPMFDLASIPVMCIPYSVTEYPSFPPEPNVRIDEVVTPSDFWSWNAGVPLDRDWFSQLEYPPADNWLFAPGPFGRLLTPDLYATTLPESPAGWVFRNVFSLSQSVVDNALEVTVRVASDDGADVFINGYLVDGDSNSEHTSMYWNREALLPVDYLFGENVIAVRLSNHMPQTAAFLAISVQVKYEVVPEPLPEGKSQSASNLVGISAGVVLGCAALAGGVAVLVNHSNKRTLRVGGTRTEPETMESGIAPMLQNAQ